MVEVASGIDFRSSSSAGTSLWSHRTGYVMSQDVILDLIACTLTVSFIMNIALSRRGGSEAEGSCGCY